MPVLIPDILTTPYEKAVKYAKHYFIVHLPCMAIQGYAIIFDQDGCWCSLCEPEQFEIAMEEQKERMESDSE